MPVRKIAVSLPPELADAVRDDASSSGQSVSGWLADAAARKLRRKLAHDLLREFEVVHGPITDTERREARKLWPA